MPGRLQGRKIVVLVDEGFEDLEFWVTVMRLREEGAAVTIAGTTPGEAVRGKHCLEATADVSVDAVDAGAFDSIVVPGGWAPDKLRRHESVTRLVRQMHEAGKIVGLICHAGLVGISAGIVGRWPRDRQPRHQGRPRERGRDVGRRARLPRRHDRVGPRRGGHPGLLPRARVGDRGAVNRLEAAPPSAELVVIGGGVVGAATAFHASRAGLRPLIVEARPQLCTLTTPVAAGAFRLQFEELEELELVRESVELFANFADVTGQRTYDPGVRERGYLWLATSERDRGAPACARRAAARVGADRRRGGGRRRGARTVAVGLARGPPGPVARGRRLPRHEGADVRPRGGVRCRRAARPSR